MEGMAEALSSGWSEGGGERRGQARCVSPGELRLCGLLSFTISVPQCAHLGSGLIWHPSRGCGEEDRGSAWKEPGQPPAPVWQALFWWGVVWGTKGSVWCQDRIPLS